MVNEILTERSKHRLAFIDAEGLASHISITSESNAGAAKKRDEQSKSGTTISKSGKGMTKNMKSSNSNLN